MDQLSKAFNVGCYSDKDGTFGVYFGNKDGRYKMHFIKSYIYP